MSKKKTYLAMGPHGWAKGESVDEAIERMLPHMVYWEGHDKVPVHVWECHKSARVDEMGTIWQKKGKPIQKVQEMLIPPRLIREYFDARSEMFYGEGVEVKYQDELEAEA